MVGSDNKGMDDWKEIHHRKKTPLQIISLLIFVLFIGVGMIILGFNLDYGGLFDVLFHIFIGIFTILICLWGIKQSHVDLKPQIIGYNKEKIVLIRDGIIRVEIIWDEKTTIDVMYSQYWKKKHFTGFIISKNEKQIQAIRSRGWQIEQMKEPFSDIIRICKNNMVQFGANYHDIKDQFV